MTVNELKEIVDKLMEDEKGEYKVLFERDFLACDKCKTTYDHLEQTWPNRKKKVVTLCLY